MRFRLVRQPKATKSGNAVFNVVNTKDEACGTITVPRGEIGDLLRHWTGGVYTPPAAKASIPAVKLPKLSKAALLRS